VVIVSTKDPRGGTSTREEPLVDAARYYIIRSLPKAWKLLSHTVFLVRVD
jgi:hypothetical protein